MARRFLPLRVLFCMIALSLAFQPSASAQQGPSRWQALAAPGGRVTLLAADTAGEVVYAATVAEVNRNPDETQAYEGGQPARSDALYKSVDAGESWEPVTNDLPPGSITMLFVDEKGGLWVGLEPQGGAGELWASSDEGRTWRAEALGRTDLRLRNMAQDADGDLLLLANAEGAAVENALYRRGSDRAWSGSPLQLPAGATGSPAAWLTADPAENRLFLTTESGALFLSVDGGLSWSAATSPADAPGAPRLALVPDRPEVALLARPGSAGLTIERSRDRGDSWSEIAARGLPSGPVAPRSIVAAGRDVALLTTDRGVYRSADGGVTWQALEGALDSSYVYQVLPLSGADGSLLAATAYGLFASDDRGALWRQAGSDLPANSAVLGLLTHSNRPEQILALIRAVGATGASVMLVSRDGGATWLPAGPSGAWQDATAWAIDPQNPDRVYLAGADFVAMSKDAGVTWKKKNLPPGVPRTAIAVAPSDPQRVYVDGTPRLVSADAGETWAELPVHSLGGSVEVARGVAVDPADANHVWFGLQDGVRESRNGGATMERAGKGTFTARWLSASPAAAGKGFQLFAGAENGGILRWDASAGDWQPASRGLPTGSNMLAFVPDPQSPGLLWATRDGGGIYASADAGANWQNAGASAGENLGLALAPNYSPEGGWYVGTAVAGVWLLGPERVQPGVTQTPPGPTSAPANSGARSGVDARIEVVWPHNFAPIQEATLANVGIRLFLPGSLETPACGWRPSVELWRAVNSEPAAPLDDAGQRTVDGQPFPYWDANDVDVSPAKAEDAKIYFLVKVDGVDTATSVWAHATDARTYFPEQLVPSGIATGAVNDIDARIQIVWPHDASGEGRDTQDASLANVAVTLFKHGTRLSVPPDWRPPGGNLKLHGAWNSEVSRPFGIEPVVYTRQSGVITYPVWEFYDVPVDRAQDLANKLYLWAEADGVRTYPTIWAHGADTRADFPAKDQPIEGCLP